MKKLIVVALVLLMASNAFALRRHTVVRSKPDIGWYAGPVIKFSEVDNESGVFVGGRGGIIINDLFYIGGAGYGLANDIHTIWYTPWYGERLDFGYGGIEFGFLSRSSHVAHMSVGVLIGGGSVDYFVNDEVFVVEPGIDLMLNVTRSFRVGFGVGYRFVDGLDFMPFDDDDLSGPTYNITFKFGRF